MDSKLESQEPVTPAIRVSNLDRLRLRCEELGQVVRVAGGMIEARLPQSTVGTLVSIEQRDAGYACYGEVIGFSEDRVQIMAYSPLRGVYPRSTIRICETHTEVLCHEGFLGQVLDPLLADLRTGAPVPVSGHSRAMPLDGAIPSPMQRQRIQRPMPLGVRVIDGLLTFGDGQRSGIFAGSGVGKSVLMGMIAKGSRADVTVIGLVGERGREVREFVERELGPEGLARSVVIAATSDVSALLRVRAAKLATTVAEFFAASGKSVLLMVDSLTRVAHAQREIGLASGELPAARAYPPSVFTMLPQLLERAGPQPEGRGNISALYTILAEGDDLFDPVADAARSVLDGHIHLTRELATRGIFPAVDILSSVSRCMSDVTIPAHRELARAVIRKAALYAEHRELIQLGGYQKGVDRELDEAVAARPVLEQFICQDIGHLASFEQTLEQLMQLARGPGGAAQ